MALTEYVGIVVRRGWIVAVLVVLVAGAAYVVGERQTPIYEASVHLVVRPARADADLGQSIAAMLRSLANDIPTHQFIQQAIERAQIETVTTDTLLSGKRLLVEVEPGEYTIAITVRDPDPHTAVITANALATLFAAQRMEWNGRQAKDLQVAVKVRDHARHADLYAPQTRLYVAAGGFLGAALGAAIAGVLEWLAASTVRSAQDLVLLDVRVLGAIRSTPRKKR
jgi:protein tyrosine kinase modulator